jgi:hypothetical protein
MTPETKEALAYAIPKSISEGFDAGYKKGMADGQFTRYLQLAVILIQCALMIWMIHSRKATDDSVNAAGRRMDQLSAAQDELLAEDDKLKSANESLMRACQPGR